MDTTLYHIIFLQWNFYLFTHCVSSFRFVQDNAPKVKKIFIDFQRFLDFVDTAGAKGQN